MQSTAHAQCYAVTVFETVLCLNDKHHTRITGCAKSIHMNSMCFFDDITPDDEPNTTLLSNE